LSREHVELDGPLAGVRLIAHGEADVRAALVERARCEGKAAGRAEAGALLDAAVARIAAAEEEARAALARIATELALEIARTLLRKELARDGHDVERIVRDTLAEAAVGRAACVVHLNPSDHARLADVRFRGGTRIEPDEGVARGDVHVETALGLLVRDVDAALASIGRKLREDLA
jgi:flagellar biosynthesis/type III secretory pathway protein FliH